MWLQGVYQFLNGGFGKVFEAWNVLDYLPSETKVLIIIAVSDTGFEVIVDLWEFFLCRQEVLLRHKRQSSEVFGIDCSSAFEVCNKCNFPEVVSFFQFLSQSHWVQFRYPLLLLEIPSALSQKWLFRGATILSRLFNVLNLLEYVFQIVCARFVFLLELLQYIVVHLVRTDPYFNHTSTYEVESIPDISLSDNLIAWQKHYHFYLIHYVSHFNTCAFIKGGNVC